MIHRYIHFLGLNIVIHDDDHDFDHHELVLALTSLHKIFDYTKIFEKSMEDIIKEKGPTEINKFEESDRIYELLKDARKFFHLEVMDIIELFCEGQKPKFSK